jgi:hypothetical protein
MALLAEITVKGPAHAQETEGPRRRSEGPGYGIAAPDLRPNVGLHVTRRKAVAAPRHGPGRQEKHPLSALARSKRR